MLYSTPEACPWNLGTTAGVPGFSDSPGTARGADLPLTREQVLHVARLARVGLTGADVEKFQHQLSDILAHFESLARIPTEGVPPTMHTLPLEGVVGEDEPRPSLEQRDALANAPFEQDGYLRVRAVLEE